MKQRAIPFFLPYQRRWILDGARLKIMEKSRQVGMSWATAYHLVRQHVIKCYGRDSWVSSRDEMQAKLFLADCCTFASLFDGAATKIQRRVLISKARTSAMAITFANNTTVHSLSSNPDAQAGKRGNRVLDEFALHGDPKLLYSIALPGITWGGQLEILSTHRGSFNFFNQLIQEARYEGNPKKFSLHRVTLQDALEQGFLAKLKAKLPANDPRQFMDAAQYFDFIRTTCPDEATFQQEYMCQPLDDRTAFLSSEMISACEYLADDQWQIALPYLPKGETLPHGDYYLGVDLGRERDLTVFWLLELVGDVMHTRLVECLAQQTFATQEGVLHELLRIPHLRRVCIDQTGMGRQFAERAVVKFGAGRVEGITFTAEVKESLAYLLRSFFERRVVRIPNDDNIRADLHAVRREVTLTGNLRFAADRGRNGHADRFWALALAIHAFHGGEAKRPKAGGGAFQIIQRPQRSSFFL
ncbi:MAG: terminase family protein [Puniceicoccales bacterium]|jgi:phage FluMu gp28-like protein|nr:terminase family protein [Puniceicoccales bacterium]